MVYINEHLVLPGRNLVRPIGTAEVQENTVYIGNIHRSVTELQLFTICQRYGEIVRFRFMWHLVGPQKGQPAGFCFVEFRTKDQAENCIANLNGKLACGQILRVRQAESQVDGVDNASTLASHPDYTDEPPSQSDHSGDENGDGNHLREGTHDGSHGNHRKSGTDQHRKHHRNTTHTTNIPVNVQIRVLRQKIAEIEEKNKSTVHTDFLTDFDIPRASSHSKRHRSPSTSSSSDSRSHRSSHRHSRHHRSHSRHRR
ncbi:putative RNA-binding protein 18 [Blattamonas nauphoetae]|uniref:RNA-binding protein 18 n=1 Tax=Blattamonas nauphoetae TaxID=2049346 RepID=A0ABQ9XK01_9EUKA|nr:putative RNA-binding protein 18 [Blattamonas nauphoetae]